MCTEPLYAIRLKTEFDEKFKRFGKRTPITVLKAVRDIGKDTSSLQFPRDKYDLLMISCGQCMQCRLLRTKQRAVMCICESLDHTDNSFITLTFGHQATYRYYRKRKNSRYISSKKAHFHEWSLDVETFQKFMKRLRAWYYNYQLSNYLLSIGRSDLVYNKFGLPFSHIRIPILERPFLLKDFKPKSIRCMHCGEYGEKYGRPHHHAILFGFQFPDLTPIYENGKKYYTSAILTKLWPFGIHRIGECTYNSCAYVSRYVTKKMNCSNSNEYYNGRKPEYVTYSTKPVLGANYFLKNHEEIVNCQEISVYADKLYKCHMPKSYDNLYKKINKDKYEQMKEERVKNALCDMDKLFKSSRSIYSKLDSNHKICMSVLRKLVRSYEQGATNFDEYLKKAKAFGLSVKYFTSSFSDYAFNFLHNKSYKDHKSRSSNDILHKRYYEFELARKRAISSCYNLRHSDETVMRNLIFYINMPNPFKCNSRGHTLPDTESIDLYDSGIDEKGEEYVF
ncbi:replication initiator protein [Sigmofec virus UA08Rod_4769]|uniref:Replication initiator protein n=1 Tax=Sigmofec virus UA08Rod_4769 TaxID=2929408 RepID=A0A976R819_9VIRU|nr:replication initiator protein [Sigmofec virus UA08Rod_4769]